MWWKSGVRVAADYPLISMSTLHALFNIPYTWQNGGSVGLGEYGIFTLWSWPYNFVLGLLSRLGLNFSIQERIFYILPILLIGIFGLRKSIKYYNISGLGIFISTIFYLTTTYLLLLIDGGQLSIALSYAFFPLVFIQILRSIYGNLKDQIISVIFLIFFASFDIRFVFILLLLLIMRFIFEIINRFAKEKHIGIGRWIYGGLFFSFLFVLFNSFWILPFKMFPLSSVTYSSLISNIELSTVTWKHAVLLLQPQWYKNVFGVVPPVNYAFIMIPILAFSAPVIFFFRENNKYRSEVIFWTLIAILGVFLAKGSNPPFGGVYSFIFNKIPGFSLFRDSTKFFFLVALSYSVLIAFSVDWLVNRFNWKLKIGNWKLSIISFLLIPYFLSLISPVYTGEMTGTFSKPINEKEFRYVDLTIEKDNQFGRVFWIPGIAPLGYSDYNHPSLEALRLTKIRPFSIGIVGSYEIFNFLREAPFMGELFKVSDIEYLVYPYPDPRRIDLKKDNIDYYFAFLDQLSKLPWIEKRITDQPVPLLKTKTTKDHLFITNNSFYVVGSDRIYWDLMKINDFDLSNSALIFTEENPGLIKDIDKNSKVLLYDKSDTDLLMSFVEREDMYLPAMDLSREPSDNAKIIKENGRAGHSLGVGWWKRESSDLIWWRDFLQTKYGIDNLDFDYGGGWAIAEGDLNYELGIKNYAKGDTLFARVMKSSKGGKVEFWQGEEKIGEVNTLDINPEKIEIKLTGYKEIPDKISTYNKADLNWYKIGKFSSGDPQITIKTTGDINVINTIAVVSEDDLNSYENEIKMLKNESRLIYWIDLSGSEKQKLFTGNLNGKLSYKRINPTKFEVDISELASPSYLIFSETYDPKWDLNGQGSKPIYSFINGFYVDKPGKYTLYFTPQKYVLPGLIVSGITFLTLMGILIYAKARKNKH